MWGITRSPVTVSWLKKTSRLLFPYLLILKFALWKDSAASGYTPEDAVFGCVARSLDLGDKWMIAAYDLAPNKPPLAMRPPRGHGAGLRRGIHPIIEIRS